MAKKNYSMSIEVDVSKIEAAVKRVEQTKLTPSSPKKPKTPKDTTSQTPVAGLISGTDKDKKKDKLSEKQADDTAGILGTLKTFAGPLAAVTGISLTLGHMWGEMTKSSGILSGVLGIFGHSMRLFFKPFGDALGTFLLPMAIHLMRYAVQFNRSWGPALLDIASWAAGVLGIGPQDPLNDDTKSKIGEVLDYLKTLAGPIGVISNGFGILSLGVKDGNTLLGNIGDRLSLLIHELTRSPFAHGNTPEEQGPPEAPEVPEAPTEWTWPTLDDIKSWLGLSNWEFPKFEWPTIDGIMEWLGSWTWPDFKWPTLDDVVDTISGAFDGIIPDFEWPTFTDVKNTVQDTFGIKIPDFKWPTIDDISDMIGDTLGGVVDAVSNFSLPTLSDIQSWLGLGGFSLPNFELPTIDDIKSWLGLDGFEFPEWTWPTLDDIKSWLGLDVFEFPEFKWPTIDDVIEWLAGVWGGIEWPEFTWPTWEEIQSWLGLDGFEFPEFKWPTIDDILNWFGSIFGGGQPEFPNPNPAQPGVDGRPTNPTPELGLVDQLANIFQPVSDGIISISEAISQFISGPQLAYGDDTTKVSSDVITAVDELQTVTDNLQTTSDNLQSTTENLLTPEELVTQAEKDIIKTPENDLSNAEEFLGENRIATNDLTTATETQTDATTSLVDTTQTQVDMTQTQTDAIAENTDAIIALDDSLGLYANPDFAVDKAENIVPFDHEAEAARNAENLRIKEEQILAEEQRAKEAADRTAANMAYAAQGLNPESNADWVESKALQEEQNAKLEEIKANQSEWTDPLNRIADSAMLAYDPASAPTVFGGQRDFDYSNHAKALRSGGEVTKNVEGLLTDAGGNIVKFGDSIDTVYSSTTKLLDKIDESSDLTNTASKPLILFRDGLLEIIPLVDELGNQLYITETHFEDTRSGRSTVGMSGDEQVNQAGYKQYAAIESYSLSGDIDAVIGAIDESIINMANEFINSSDLFEDSISSIEELVSLVQDAFANQDQFDNIYADLGPLNNLANSITTGKLHEGTGKLKTDQERYDEILAQMDRLFNELGALPPTLDNLGNVVIPDIVTRMKAAEEVKQIEGEASRTGWDITSWNSEVVPKFDEVSLGLSELNEPLINISESTVSIPDISTGVDEANNNLTNISDTMSQNQPAINQNLIDMVGVMNTQNNATVETNRLLGDVAAAVNRVESAVSGLNLSVDLSGVIEYNRGV